MPLQMNRAIDTYGINSSQHLEQTLSWMGEAVSFSGQ